MKEIRCKYGLRLVDAEMVNEFPERFELKVNPPNPPLCLYGNPQKYVGFDRETSEYVRLTKSVFRKFFNNLRKQGKLDG